MRDEVDYLQLVRLLLQVHAWAEVTGFQAPLHITVHGAYQRLHIEYLTAKQSTPMYFTVTFTLVLELHMQVGISFPNREGRGLIQFTVKIDSHVFDTK